jgi:hypothetical protein
MKERLWQMLAWIVSRPVIANWLIWRAASTPYVHLNNYMNRYWLFNGYDRPRYREWLPSIRIHHILREDRAEHLHDHPWDARTIILRGWYGEQRENGFHGRVEGDTAAVRFGEYHQIHVVSPGGVFTMFITWKYVGTWGFKVDGYKVPWRTYLAQHPERDHA